MSRQPRHGRARRLARALSLGLSLIVATVLLGPRAVADYPPGQTTFGSCVLHLPPRVGLDRYGYFKGSITGDCRDIEHSQGYWQVNGSPLNGWAALTADGAQAWVNPARVNERQVVTFTRAGAWPGESKDAYCPALDLETQVYPTSHPEASSNQGHPLYLRHRSPVRASCVTKLLQNQPQVEVRRVRRAVPVDPSPMQAVAPAGRSSSADSDLETTTRPAARARITDDPSYTGLCVLVPPARVVISRQHTVLPAKISGPCAASGGLGYWFTNPGTQDGRFATAAKYLDGAFIDIDDDIDTTNWPMTWSGFGAWRSQAAFEARHCSDNGAPPVDPEEASAPLLAATDAGHPLASLARRLIPQCTELDQNEPVTDIRLATAAKIAVRRSGGSVTLGATTQMYNVRFNHQFGPAALTGVFQYREHGGTTWHTLVQLTTHLPTGGTQITYPTSRIRDYRFIVLEPESYSAQSVSAVVTA